MSRMFMLFYYSASHSSQDYHLAVEEDLIGIFSVIIYLIVTISLKSTKTEYNFIPHEDQQYFLKDIEHFIKGILREHSL